MSVDQKKRAAKRAITLNTASLNEALSSNETVFSGVVQKCVDEEFFSVNQQNDLFDPMCGKTLPARVQSFVSQIATIVGVLPNKLDDFVYILFAEESLLTKEAATKVAQKYGYKLHKYESAGGSVSSASASDSPSEASSGSVRSKTSHDETGNTSSSLQVSEVEEMETDLSPFGSKKNKKKGETTPADDILHKYQVNEKGDHGVALIINNVTFEGEGTADRTSSNKDAERLEEVLKGLRYQVIIREDLKAADMKKVLSAIAAGLVLPKHDSFICCILSHGNPEGIEGVDGKTVTVTELAKIINAKECSALHGKPKIFFFQACRGSEMPEPIVGDSSNIQWPPNEGEEMVADGLTKALPPEADFIFGFSTAEGNIAARGIYSGSQYIKALCKFIPKYASRLSLYELLLLVNHDISGNPVQFKVQGKDVTYQQMPEIRSTLRGKFYFEK